MEYVTLLSRQNQNYCLIRQVDKYFDLIEVSFEVSDNNRPKDPIIFRISKKIHEHELSATFNRFWSIIQSEFPDNEWFSLLEEREAAEGNTSARII